MNFQKTDLNLHLEFLFKDQLFYHIMLFFEFYFNYYYSPLRYLNIQFIRFAIIFNPNFRHRDLNLH